MNLTIINYTLFQYINTDYCLELAQPFKTGCLIIYVLMFLDLAELWLATINDIRPLENAHSLNQTRLIKTITHTLQNFKVWNNVSLVGHNLTFLSVFRFNMINASMSPAATTTKSVTILTCKIALPKCTLIRGRSMENWKTVTMVSFICLWWIFSSMRQLGTC